VIFKIQFAKMSRKRFIILSSINDYKRQSTSIKLVIFEAKLSRRSSHQWKKTTSYGKAVQVEKEKKTNVFRRILDRIGDF
jgi:hypothetical protein